MGQLERLEFPAYVPSAVIVYIRSFEGRNFDDLECLERLARDKRMKRAYNLLEKVFTEDWQWKGLIRSALGARMKFATARIHRQEASDLSARLANSLQKSARLLRELVNTRVDPDKLADALELFRATDGSVKTGVGVPDELIDALARATDGSVKSGVEVPYELTDASALLRATDGSDRMWRTVRDRVTGNQPRQTLSKLRYGWMVAPSPADLLETMAKAAEHFDPPARGAVGRATSNRQGSEKTDYLKTFAGLLEVHHVARVADLAKDSILAIPMAIVATVVLNNPNEVIATRDFRQALAPIN